MELHSGPPNSLLIRGTFGGIYWSLFCVSFCQLVCCYIVDGIRNTCQKFLHGFVVAACLSRAIYYSFSDAIPDPFRTLLYDSFYLFLLSCYASIITYWAGFYNQKDRQQIASKTGTIAKLTR
jgi:hypothetical protein